MALKACKMCLLGFPYNCEFKETQKGSCIKPQVRKSIPLFRNVAPRHTRKDPGDYRPEYLDKIPEQDFNSLQENIQRRGEGDGD